MNYLTLDVGTTSVKACIFDSKLHLICKSKQEYTLETSGIMAEVSASVYTAAIRACIGALDRSLPISAISITTQGETLIPVGMDGQPLRKAIVWLDGRAGKQAEELRRSIDSQYFYEHTGLPDLSAALPLCKLMWLRENEPALWSKTHKILLLEDYLLFWLTGRYVSEKSLLTSTGWFHITDDCYWQEILDKAGIELSKLPEAVECGTNIGRILPERAYELGLSPEAQVITGAMDQTAGAVAAGVTAPGRISETTGTAMVAAAYTENPVFREGHHLTIYRSVRPHTYIYLPISNTAGMALKWIRDNVFYEELPEGTDAYDHLDELADAAGAGAGGTIFLPYLSGECDPETLDGATALFYGLRLSTTRGDMTRAVLEAVAYQLRDFLGMLSDLNCPIDRVCSLGGGAYSPLWLQIKADVCSLPLNVLSTNEATSLGVAALALKAMEGRDMPEELLAGTYYPETSRRDVYDRTYAIYRKLHEVMRPLYSK